MSYSPSDPVPEVHVGDVGKIYRIPITRQDDAIDLTTVTAATLSVLRPDRTEATWTCTLVSGATASALTIEHVLVTGDLPLPGRYSLYAVLSTPGGPRTTNRWILTVKGEYAL